jgi:hypothetical protein
MPLRLKKRDVKEGEKERDRVTRYSLRSKQIQEPPIKEMVKEEPASKRVTIQLKVNGGDIPGKLPKGEFSLGQLSEPQRKI